jgi:hypothetical protein
MRKKRFSSPQYNGQSVLLSSLLACCTLSCSGVVSSLPLVAPEPPLTPADNEPAASRFMFEADAQLQPRLRLKSNAEIYASLRGALGVTVKNQKILPSEAIDKNTGFSNTSNAHRLGETMFLAVQALAAEAAEQVTDAVLLTPCAGKTGAACASAVALTHGQKLFSRAPSAEEREALAQVYSAVLSVGTENDALRAVIEGLVQMPSFLYRTEVGGLEATPKRSLAPTEISAALASFLWNAPPDDELVAAALNGQLENVAGVEKQARRMLADPKAKSAFASFALEWLDELQAASQPRDPTAFPTFTPRIAENLVQETREFAATTFAKNPTLKGLLSSKTTHLNQTLSQFYGFGAVTTDAFEQVAVPEFKAGILSQGAFMLAHSGEAETSPIKTGSFVRRRLLCESIAPAPPTAPTKVDPPTGGQTVRDVFNQHTKAGCKNCHVMMNPIGFGFENLDPVGKTRTLFNGLPIDSSGEIVSGDRTSSRPFQAGTGLFEALSEMPEVSDCFTLRVFQYALGRAAGKQDQALLETVAKRFRGAEPRIDELMIAIVTSDAFLSREIR